jgi:hypothetical protein
MKIAKTLVTKGKYALKAMFAEDSKGVMKQN